MKKNKVIVLILSYNGKHLLEDSISSYLENEYSNFEVVVIDNGSTDNTKEYVEDKWPEVIVLRTENNLGYSGGFNFGLDFAFYKENADYVLITNNDVKADRNVIPELVKVAETDSSIGFVTGKVYFYDQPEILQSTGKYGDSKYWRGGHRSGREKDVGQFDKVEQIDWCDDIFWLVNRNLYLKTKGYDTEFQFQAEDFDWQVRAKEIGYSIYYTPFAKIWHKESMTIGKTSSFKTYYDARNPLIVHLKHRKPREVQIYMRRQIKFQIRSSIKYLLKLKFSYFTAIWSGYFSALFWARKNNKLTIKHFI
jgi:GT2 family glycosyltransferase